MSEKNQTRKRECPVCGPRTDDHRTAKELKQHIALNHPERGVLL